MAIHVEIEKSFKGFSLKTAFDSKSSATEVAELLHISFYSAAMRQSSACSRMAVKRR